MPISAQISTDMVSILLSFDFYLQARVGFDRIDDLIVSRNQVDDGDLSAVRFEFAEFIQIKGDELFYLEDIQSIRYALIFRENVSRTGSATVGHDDRSISIIDVLSAFEYQRFGRCGRDVNGDVSQ
ncbi:MAG: hypothetical protein PHT60_13840 [Acidiphilium sp.]|nr:hypothetical protein [Acidiphilium sp.]MDD4936846.1 hypothetical protein [Acidiphilium sp.]